MSVRKERKTNDNKLTRIHTHTHMYTDKKIYMYV